MVQTAYLTLTSGIINDTTAANTVNALWPMQSVLNNVNAYL
jgi:hypothetical protein